MAGEGMQLTIAKRWKQILAAAGAVAVVCGIVFAALWSINRFYFQVTPVGEEEVTVEYGQAYEEQGAKSIFFGTVFQLKAVHPEVTIEGSVDTQRLGTYTVYYSSEASVNLLFGKYTLRDSAQRTVRVVDTQAPEIKLVSSPDTFTFPGQKYQEEGFTAVDNHDGWVTNRVERVQTPEAVIYRVTDTSGNTAEVRRVIVYDDPVAPTLTLKGSDTLSITVGGSFSEPGYTAEDNCDGDLTEKVTVSGSVDFAKIGTYTLEYAVTDSYGNTAKATRTVQVKAKPVYVPPTIPGMEPSLAEPLVPGEPNGKIVYLTFDDGPSAHTPRLLDILAKYNVKATFFVVNTGYIHLVQRIAAEGHTVAMHTATHDFGKVYASEEAYFSDLYLIQSQITKYTGQTPMMLRFPGGSSNTASSGVNKGIMSRLVKEVEARGFKYFDWNVSSGDAGGTTNPDVIYYNVVSGISKHNVSVVLQHDLWGYSVDAVERIIRWGIANGYTFLPLSYDSFGAHHGVNN